jgi:hypothetical protein
MKKQIIVFIIVCLAIVLLFFLSHQPIFDVVISDAQFTYPKKFSFSELLTSQISYQLTLQSILVLIISLIGLPALVAWRSTLTKYNRKTGEPKKSIWDKF